MNEVSQLKVAISQATSGNERAAPMREPLSKMLDARPRSLSGNHFEATLAIDGYAPASPTPSSRRQPNRVANPRAAEVSAVNADHQTTATASGDSRTHPVGEPAEGQLHHRVGPEEPAEDEPHGGGVEPQLALHNRGRNREVGAIDVVDRAASGKATDFGACRRRGVPSGPAGSPRYVERS